MQKAIEIGTGVASHRAVSIKGFGMAPGYLSNSTGGLGDAEDVQDCFGMFGPQMAHGSWSDAFIARWRCGEYVWASEDLAG